MTTATFDTVNVKYFDTLEYVQKSKELIDPEALATYQVKQIEQAIETAVQHVKQDVSNKDLVTKNDLLTTKNDLKKEIQQLRYDTLKFIVWTGATVIVSLGGLMIGLAAFH